MRTASVLIVCLVACTAAASPIEVGTIINDADQAWRVIEANKPTVVIRSARASALPRGVSHWTDLDHWQAPEGTLYALRARNTYGVTVVEVRYQVLRTFGGSHKGRGRYLAAVAVVPQKIDVAWGYKLDLDVSVPSVTNVGTHEDPVAGVLMELHWTIRTPLQHAEGTRSFYVQGDGEFRELGGTNPAPN